jgi:GcrA cell cycle regulator
MSWTDDRVALLRKMWGEGKTAAEIARELGGVTRNAVIGKAHRLRLSNRISPIQQNSKKASRPMRAGVAAPPTGSKAKAFKAVIKVKGIRLTELKEKMCRWPLGDPKEADFLFCGCAAAPGLPYCGDHARIAYQTGRNSRILQPQDVDGTNYADADEKEAVGA